MESSAMSTLVTELLAGGTQILSTVGDVADVIVENPLLLLTTCFLFVGGCVGIFGRLLSRG